MSLLTILTDITKPYNLNHFIYLGICIAVVVIMVIIFKLKKLTLSQMLKFMVVVAGFVSYICTFVLSISPLHTCNTFAPVLSLIS